MADADQLFTEAPEEVTRYFDSKGLKPSEDWRDFAMHEHAVDFTVARSAGAAASHAGAAIRKAARRRFRNRFSAFFIVHNSARSRRNSQPNSP